VSKKIKYIESLIRCVICYSRYYVITWDWIICDAITAYHDGIQSSHVWLRNLPYAIVFYIRITRMCLNVANDNLKLPDMSTRARKYRTTSCWLEAFDQNDYKSRESCNYMYTNVNKLINSHISFLITRDTFWNFFS